MIKAVKWLIITLVGLLGTFFIVYAIYCKAYDRTPMDLFAFYKAVISNNELPQLQIPNIPEIPQWVVSANQQGSIIEALSYLVNFFSGVVNFLSSIVNFAIMMTNITLSIVRWLIVVITLVFGGAIN